MGASQRTKGAVYEREVCDALTAATGRKIKRHIGQARDGGHDITVGRLVVECKRRKSLKTLMDWMNQCRRAAARLAPEIGEPVALVVMREDNGRSHVLLSLDDFLRVVNPSLIAEKV